VNIYEVTTGKFRNDAGIVLGIAYSGGDCGKSHDAVNNPAMQAIPFVGPIPEGQYIIEAPVDTVTHGPYFLPLTPNPTNEMYGRSAFGIHGDSVVNPGKKMASEGCIVGLPRMIREAIWNSGDHELTVVREFNVVQEADV
jgi:hypothetical protein